MKRFAIVLSLLGLLTGAVLLPSAAHAADTVTTDATLFVGFPLEADDASRGVLVVPGTVIPYHGPNRAALALPGKASLDREEARSAASAQLGMHLSSTFRLSRIDVAYRETLSLGLDEARELPRPAPTSSVTIEVELLGFTRTHATYQVRFLDGSSVLADSRVSAVRGERTVIGGVDGDEAPYLFLVLEPRRLRGEPREVSAEDGISAPRAVSKVRPEYTAEGKEARVTGIVIVQAVINEQGVIEDTRVLKGLPLGLSEAAVTAIRQWTFEPARDADGNPVAVYYNLTVNFTLQ